MSFSPADKTAATSAGTVGGREGGSRKTDLGAQASFDQSADKAANRASDKSSGPKDSQSAGSSENGSMAKSPAQGDGEQKTNGRKKRRRARKKGAVSDLRNQNSETQVAGYPSSSVSGAVGSDRSADGGLSSANAGGLTASSASADRQASDPDGERSGKRRRRRRNRKGGQGQSQAVHAPIAASVAGPVSDGATKSTDGGADRSVPSGGGDAARSRDGNRDRNARSGRGRNGHRGSGQNAANGSRSSGQNGQRQGYGRRVQENVPLYAALDLGTNNCRLLIAQPDARGFRVVDAFSRIVRLGEGIEANKRLGEGAMDRAIGALSMCRQKLGEYGVTRSRLIATEACRAAGNGSDFIARVEKETGLSLEIVDRETEARLAVAGCTTLVDREADGVILFDIGGGSSEIVWLDLRNRCGARGYALTRFIRAWTSLPLGVVNLAERHGGMHVTPQIFEAMVQDVTRHLEKSGLDAELDEAIGSDNFHMLGTSGTVTTLAGVQLGLRRYDRKRVDGTWLQDTQVGEMIDCLRDMSYEDRVANPCIGADRADLVLAGCAILEAIRRRWSCSRLRVADRGLREGILTELMAADGVWSRKRTGRGNNRQRGRK